MPAPAPPRQPVSVSSKRLKTRPRPPRGAGRSGRSGPIRSDPASGGRKSPRRRRKADTVGRVAAHAPSRPSDQPPDSTAFNARRGASEETQPMRVDLLTKEYPPFIYGGAGVHVEIEDVQLFLVAKRP